MILIAEWMSSRWIVSSFPELAIQVSPLLFAICALPALQP